MFDAILSIPIQLIILTSYFGAIVCALRELMVGRTNQGKVAWMLAFIFIPFVSVWIYMIFAWKDFRSYRTLRRFKREFGSDFSKGLPMITWKKNLQHDGVRKPGLKRFHLQEIIARMPFTHNNSVDLFFDSAELFKRLYKDLEQAKNYVLVQYYILRNDDTGREFKDALIKCAKSGKRVLLLYDRIGCSWLSRSYLKDLDNGGVWVVGFNKGITLLNLLRPLKINFRNHRKIVVIDGKIAYLGGMNIGDEYSPKSKLKQWKDTHMRINGPAAISCQLSYCEDWLWETGESINVDWIMQSPTWKGKKSVLVIPTGPADSIESAVLVFLDIISRANKYIWLSSPYFVPDQEILTALYAAVIRGVEVIIIFPKKCDNWFIDIAHVDYIERLVNHGVKCYYYGDFFNHQKVLVVDDLLATVGTVNFDNRSFRINFEITSVLADKELVAILKERLACDLEDSFKVPEDYAKKLSKPIRLLSKAVCLFNPLL